jgi:ceramide glucosyltransferase
MQDLILLLVLAVLLGAVVVSIGYWLLASAVIAAWMREPRRTSTETPPLTLLRPLKNNAPGLLETLDALARAARADDQIVLGVERGSEAASQCERWRARFSERDISVVSCAAEAALNPKIAKLMQMTPHVRHEHWVLSDCEAIFDAEFLTAFRAEWADSRADALTCGYRFIGLRTWPQQLDAAAALLTLWPGLACVRRFATVRWTLGACTGMRRSDLAALGGWAAFGDDLAEDNRLGAALVCAGRTVRLSREVVTLASDALTWREYWRHQRRVAVTYRVANPAGFAGSLFVQGLPLAALAMCVPHPLAPSIGATMFFLAWVARYFGARDAARRLDFPIPRLVRVIVVASFVETVCWLFAWFSLRVWWAGKWWRVSHDGKLRPVENEIAG